MELKELCTKELVRKNGHISIFWYENTISEEEAITRIVNSYKYTNNEFNYEMTLYHDYEKYVLESRIIIGDFHIINNIPCYNFKLSPSFFHINHPEIQFPEYDLTTQCKEYFIKVIPKQ